MTLLGTKNPCKIQSGQTIPFSTSTLRRHYRPVFIAEVLLTEYSVLKCVSFVSHLMYKSRFCDPPGVNAVRLPFLLEL